MFEKSAGNVHDQKLQAIPLLVADFNAMHEIIINNSLIPNIEAANTILIEVIGDR